jgi:hypothetical protein
MSKDHKLQHGTAFRPSAPMAAGLLALGRQFDAALANLASLQMHADDTDADGQLAVRARTSR